MTRGTGIIMYNDKNGNLKLAYSTEFNRDMNAEGYGQEFLELMRGVKDRNAFLQVIRYFNDKNFNYDRKNEGRYTKWDSDMLVCSPRKKITTTDFSDIIEDYDLHSDYLYFNNLSNQEFECKNYKIKPNKIAVIDGLNERLCNNFPDQAKFTGLERLENRTVKNGSLEWREKILDTSNINDSLDYCSDGFAGWEIYSDDVLIATYVARYI